MSSVFSLIRKPFIIEGKNSYGRTYDLDVFNNATLFVPVGTIDKYKAIDGWKDFLFIEEFDTGDVYTLSYVVDGVEYKTYKFAYGETITPEEEPTKEGYTFSGWSDIPETMPAEDVTVTGTFTINKYKLTYIIDGEEYKTYEVEYGAKITPEPTPTKEGYTFSGWSDIPETMPANDVKVYGTFSVDESEYAVRDGIKYKKTSANECEVISGGSCSGDVVIPEKITSNGKEYTVTSIGARAFYEYNISSVTIPNSVTSIGEYTFAKCRNLTTAVIPNSVTYIGQWAFMGTGITSVIIPDGITSLEESIFNGCDYLSSVIIPNSVNSIGRKAFYRCLSLASINIPNSVTSIGELAFWECRSLTSITIPNSVTSIGAQAFNGEDEDAPKITTVISLIENPYEIYGKSSYATNRREYLGVFTKEIFDNATLYVPKGTINKYKATNGWKDFANINEDTQDNPINTEAIVNGIKYKITSNSECEVVQKEDYSGDIVIPESVSINGKEYKVTAIANEAFIRKHNVQNVGCDITSIIIPNSIKSIGKSAFAYCKDLKEVKLSEDISVLDSSTFGFCI